MEAEQPAPQKQKCYVSIDPAFKKCGIVCITRDLKILSAENYSFLGAKEDKKQSIVEYSRLLYESILSKMRVLNETYEIERLLIEQQIGQFACVQVQLMLIIAQTQIDGAIPIVTVSPRLKLSESFGCDFVPDSSTKQYNQNKQKGLAYAKTWLEKTGQSEAIGASDKDCSDALLQAVAYISKLR